MNNSKQQKTALFILGLLLFANIAVWIVILNISNPEVLKICFLDVGQGDAIFIEINGLYQILIDGGPGKKILEKLSQEMPFWDKTLDLIILTHPEKDHMEGLIGILDSYKVNYIAWTGVLRNTAVFEAWQKAIEREKETGGKVKIIQAGQKIIFPKTVFRILHPFENLEGTMPKDSNKTSIVFKLSFGRTAFLFTGDIYQAEEKKLIEQGSNLVSDVLKLAHHGSKTSTCEEFIAAVSPTIAVVQAGKNNAYGHPRQEVLDRLTNQGVETLRTDINGDIKIISDGNYLTIK